LKEKLNKSLNNIRSKNFESVGKEALASAVSLNVTLTVELTTLKEQVGEAETSYDAVKKEFEVHQERLR
jgi:hypothetical protein